MCRAGSCVLTSGLFLGGVATLLLAQATQQPAGQARNGEDRDRVNLERFRAALENNPKRGTAFDRVYGYHVERGLLEGLVGEYQERARKNPGDGVAWMILGMIHAQRGQEGAAVKAFREAETHLANNAFAPFYLGQALVLVGQPQEAASAFERAIARRPQRPEDLQEFYHALGLVYQRAQQTDKALAVWARLEKEFPDDLALQEDIAATLAEEGQHDLALKRFETLAGKTRDRYRQIAYRVEAADLKVKLQRRMDALADYETLLAQLDPEDWVHREVRRKLEEVFLHDNDAAGLIRYYEEWLKKNGDEAEVMGRLARALALIGQTAGAQDWLAKAVQMAPRQRELRQLLIDQNLADQKFDQAIKQYEALLKDAPNDPEYLRECGKLHLRDAARPEDERKKAAAAVWKRLLAARPRDAFAFSQVAELLRSADLAEEAIAHYRQAIVLAPADPQYVVQLGEYYHALGKAEEALATWRTMAEGTKQTPANLTQLVETLAAHGYLEEALAASADLCRLDDKSFRARLRHAELLYQDEEYDKALHEVDLAGALAATDDEAENALVWRIRALQAAEKLAPAAAALRADLLAGMDATPRRWYQLARLQEAIRQLPEATAAIQKCLALEPRWPLAWVAAARIHEASGNLLQAVEAYRQLATLDRRGRAEYLNLAARLEARLGLREQAFLTGQEVLALAAASPENYRAFAELCFQIGKTTEAIDALRKAVRANPAGVDGMLALAKALADQFQVNEAIEFYWKAFEKAGSLESKLAILPPLTQLHLQTNQFDRFLERLQRDRNEAEKRRATTFCVAMAHNAAGDHATARQELERLLGDNRKDALLLQQLSFLAEREGDVATAAKHQRALVDLAPNDQGAQSRLAQLLIATGATDEAAAIWLKLASREQDHSRQLEVIDNLIYFGKYDAALNLLHARLRTEPRNWELLYRAAVAHDGLGQADAARQRIEALLALNLSDDEPSVMLEQTKKSLVKTSKKIRAARRTQSPETRQLMGADEYPLLDRWEVLYGGAFGGGGGMGRGRVTLPMDFGQARGLCLGWLQDHARDAGKHAEFLADLQKRKDRPGTSSRALWDWLYLNVVRGGTREWYSTALALSKFPEVEGKALHLETLDNRPAAESVPSGGGRTNIDDDVQRLPDDQIEHALRCYEVVKREKPGWLTELAYENLAVELRRAKRLQDEQRIYEEAVEMATTQQAVVFVFNLAAARGDVESALKLFDRLERFQAPGSNLSRQAAEALARLMERQAEKNQLADVRRILDQYLATQRRLRQEGASQPPPPAAFSITSSPGAFPDPSEFHDEGSLMLLRQAHQVHDQAQALPELLEHLRKQLPDATPSDRIPLHLAMAYLHWFAGQQDESEREVLAAAALVPDHLGLRFEVALVRELRGDRQKALAVLDGITAIDQPTLFRKENAALRLAQRLNDVPRARDAAERLFGLRLDADAQIALAAQLRRLGMPERADALLARAQRQAGHRADLLLGLMRQYQQDARIDQAVQVAMQIMRLPPPPQPAQPRWGRSEEANPRAEAIRFLASSGRLRDLIGRVEEQLKLAPKSMQLLRTLAEYHEAGGEKEKLRDVYVRMAEVRPNDAQMRYQVAYQLGRLGEVDAALGQFRAAIDVEPQLFDQDPSEVRQFLGGREHELLTGLDLRKFEPRTVLAAALRLLTSTDLREKGWELYQRAWDAFPLRRFELVAGVEDESIWKEPRFYDYARQGLLPQDETHVLRGWDRFGPSMDRLAEAARRHRAVPKLRSEIESLLPKHPDWMASHGLLALLDWEEGRVEEAARQMIELANHKRQPMPWPAVEMLAAHLEKNPVTMTQAIALYEKGTSGKDLAAPAYAQTFHRRLVKLYERAKREEDARRLLRRLAHGVMHPPEPAGGFPGAPGQQPPRPQLSSMVVLADDLDALGEPLEATHLRVHLLNNWVLDDNEPPPAVSQGVVEQAVRQRLAHWQTEALGTTLRAALLAKEGDGAETPTTEAFPPFLLARPQDWPTLESVYFSLLRSVRQDDALRKEGLRLVDARLRAQPGDAVLLISRAHLALGDPDSSVGKTALEQLHHALAAAPLEKLVGPATPRQKAAALAYLAAWFVARDALRHEQWRSDGAALGAIALEAARRQDDGNFGQAILREWGQIALETGNREEAEKQYARLHEWVRGEGQNPAGDQPAVLSSEQFQQAMRLARLAAAQGMTGLSLRVIREALRAGPPLEDSEQGGLIIINGRLFRRTSDSRTHDGVGAELVGVEQLWRQANAPAASVYETLHAVVLPEGRPGEVFVYPMNVPLDDARQVHSAGKLLAYWAVAAGKAPELRQRVESLKGKRADEFAAKTLLVQLGIAAGDTALAREALGWLAQRTPKESTSSNVVIAYHAALPALHVDELMDLAIPILQNYDAAKGQVDNAILWRIHLAITQRLHQQGKDAGANHDNYKLLNPLTHADLILAKAAIAFRANRIDEGLDLLGHVADASPWCHQAPEAAVEALAALHQALAKLKPEERYERLRRFTMPDEGRAAIRFMVGSLPAALPPPSLGLAVKDLPPADAGRFTSTLGLLLDAAKAAGKEEALIAELQKLADDNVVNADLAHVMVLSLAGKGKSAEEAVGVLLEKTLKHVATIANSEVDRADPAVPLWTAFQLTHVCLLDPQLRALGLGHAPRVLAAARAAEKLLGQREHVERLITYLQRDLGLAKGDGLPASTFKHWLARDPGGAGLGGKWAVVNGTSACGVGRGSLCLAYPLTGSFTVHADVLVRDASEGMLGYGGVHFRLGGGPGRRAEVRMDGGSEILPIALATPLANGFHKVALEIGPDRVRCLVNGQPFHESPGAGATSPWLRLWAHPDGPAVFQNVRITGSPMIPREVRLTAGDHLEGWTASLARATHTPPRLLLGRVGDDGQLVLPLPFPQAYDWYAQAGEIHGRGQPSLVVPRQLPSRLASIRPLASAETVRYEFYHAPGRFHVHPALGRLAFLLESDGVRLHWLTPELCEARALGIADGRVARGEDSGRLPLKPNEWNQLAMALKGNVLTLTLNGARVLEHRLEPVSDRSFGLFHFQDETAAWVRNVVLTGDWPSALPGDLWEEALPPSAEQMRIRQAVVSEWMK